MDRTQMSLDRLADELDETLRQLAHLVDQVAGTLDILADPAVDAETARKIASQRIVAALQGQDRIEQRGRGLGELARRLAASGAAADAADPWRSLVLDELRKPGVSRPPAGEVDLF